MVELRVPAMIHVSGSCNDCLHATGSYYMAADTNAFMNLMTGDLFSDFPELNFIIPHGGGAVPYHWGRYRGLADMMKRPSLDEYVMRNVYQAITLTTPNAMLKTSDLHLKCVTIFLRVMHAGFIRGLTNYSRSKDDE